MKAVVAAFNQEKALVGAFSVITNLRMEFGCNFLKPLSQKLTCNEYTLQTSQYFRTPDDKLRWAFKMYDEDNSREIDIREMESVMVVSR